MPGRPRKLTKEDLPIIKRILEEDEKDKTFLVKKYGFSGLTALKRGLEVYGKKIVFTLKDNFIEPIRETKP
jgi:hypothetical protein